MGKSKLIFIDSIPFDNSEIRNYISDGKPVEITMDATFAGLPTLNETIYLPVALKEAANIVNTAKIKLPFLKNHDTGEGGLFSGGGNQDPIGRLISAQYIDYSTNYSTDADIMNFASDNASIEDKVKAVPKLQTLSLQNEFEGVGKLQIKANVSDLDALQKMVDGRLSGVSTGFNPGTIYCTICGMPFDAEEPCEHIIGQEGCLAMPDSMILRETSTTAMPAVILAHITNIDGIKEFRLTDNVRKIWSFNKTSKLFLTDKVGDKDMGKSKTKKDEVKKVDKDVVKKDKKEEIKKDEDDKKAEPENKKAEKPEESLNDGYEAIAKWLDENKLGDKKLSVKERKALPDNTFCGPDRTFPCNDQAHYTVALRLLPYKKDMPEATRTKTKACVLRKGKALGFTKKKDNLELLEVTKDLNKHYQRINELIPGNCIKSVDEISKLSESNFSGMDKSFPSFDNYYTSASLSVLDKDFVEDTETSIYAELYDALFAKSEQYNQNNASEINKLKSEIKQLKAEISIIKKSKSDSVGDQVTNLEDQIGKIQNQTNDFVTQLGNLLKIDKSDSVSEMQIAILDKIKAEDKDKEDKQEQDDTKTQTDDEDKQEDGEKITKKAIERYYTIYETESALDAWKYLQECQAKDLIPKDWLPGRNI